MNDKIIMFSGENKVSESEATLGTAVTRVKRYHEKDGVHAGFWKCFAGTFTIEAHAVNEMCHILEGEGTITHFDGTVCPIKAGDSFFIPRKTKMVWQVETYLRKVYMASS